MKILLILLLILQINSLKADEIFNLVKIPNLEVYKLNNLNGLKYLNAKKDFKIGIKNNIRCNKSNKQNLDNKFSLISKNLARYDADFLNRINLRFIVLCENLYVSEINTGGIPDHAKRTLILDLNFNEKYFERVMHHEIFHIIHNGFTVLFDEEIWSDLNDKTFKYAECSTCSNRLGLDLYLETNGFLTEYSKSIASEDMAEVYSFLMTDKINIENMANKDSILFNKVEYIKTRIDKILNF
jgi:hypothetical protein|tara:strand:+ start:78 stop:800 length:723 start_codon:yes stop_codon:yes gene_type:complete